MSDIDTCRPTRRSEIREELAALRARVKELETAIRGLFDAMDFCLGRQWRITTITEDEGSDEVNAARVALEKVLCEKEE